MEAFGSSFPRTESSISRPRMARSTIIFCANSAAKSIAAASSFASCALVIPTELPSVAGFTNTGKRNFLRIARRIFPREFSHSARGMARNSPTGSLACRNRRFCMSLSMPTAEPITPEPTYGSPARSSRPCTVPSSPNVPCSTGNTTSTRNASVRELLDGNKRGHIRIGGKHDAFARAQHFAERRFRWGASVGREHLVRGGSGQPAAVLRDADGQRLRIFRGRARR